jgi:hypothetical protein
MPTLLTSFTIKHPRDLARARQLARQAADLLGFDATDRATLAAAAFDLACQAALPTGRAGVVLEIADDCLQVACTAIAARGKAAADAAPLRLGKPLPASGPFPREDVPWMLKQLTELTPADPLEELRQANRELLATLLELAACQARHKSRAGSAAGPSAA